MFRGERDFLGRWWMSDFWWAIKFIYLVRPYMNFNFFSLSERHHVSNKKFPKAKNGRNRSYCHLNTNYCSNLNIVSIHYHKVWLRSFFLHLVSNLIRMFQDREILILWVCTLRGCNMYSIFCTEFENVGWNGFKY